MIDQAVTYSGFGNNVAWTRGIPLDLPPKSSNVDSEIVRLSGVGGAPDLAKKIAMRDNLAGIGDQDMQQIVFLRC